MLSKQTTKIAKNKKKDRSVNINYIATSHKFVESKIKKKYIYSSTLICINLFNELQGALGGLCTGSALHANAH